MKKSIIFITLLAVSHLAMASCITSVDYAMSIKNSTEHTIYLDSCTGFTNNGPSVSIQSGDIYQGASAEPGGATYSTTPSCQYTVQTDSGGDSLQSGTLYFNFNSCTDIEAETSNTLSGNTINAYACPSVTNNYGTGYNSISGIYIITQTHTYEIVWNNIKTSLVKGQVMAATLANSLTKTGTYQQSKASYNYDNKKIAITLTESAGNPYPTDASTNQCNDVNNGISS